MASELPEPLTSAECDCTDLDGFMLNVERLMASELVALSSHEVVAAALFLWCRAWKQRPAASLPDDDRVNAAFARLPIAKFKKLKDEILRGFVKCSDGRLYHRTLAAEAMRAFASKLSFRKRRENDAERLRKWRKNKDETQDETPNDTPIETRFVAEGQVRDREGTGIVIPEAKASGDKSPGVNSKPAWWPRRDRYKRLIGEPDGKILFAVAETVMGKKSGGLVGKLRNAYGHDDRKVLEILLEADDLAHDGRSWINGVLKKIDTGDTPSLPYPASEKYPEHSY